jgi:hypothetical protein
MSEIKRIIHIIETRSTERDFRRFGIRNLQDNGFTVEVWNILPISHPEVFSLGITVPEFNFPEHRLFVCGDDVKDAITHLPAHTFVNCFFGYSWKTLFIFRVLSQRRIPYGIFTANTVPIPESWQKTATPREFLLRMRMLGFRRVLDHAMNHLILKYFRWFGIRPATICLAGGEASLSKVQYPFDHTTRILWIHSMDYDIYLKVRSQKRESDSSLAVFLDDNLIYDLEYVYFGESPPSSPEEYYGKLNRFFDTVERTLGVKIQVAAHPGSRYEDGAGIFGGRSILRDGTAELVQRSGIVIAHGSTAVSYAVLFHKPVIFITDNRIREHHHGPYVERIAALLGKKPINLDGEIHLDASDARGINSEAYRSYRNAYIKREGSPDLPFWQIFSDHIKLNFPIQ